MLQSLVWLPRAFRLSLLEETKAYPSPFPFRFNVMVSFAWHIVTAREHGWTFTLADHSWERSASSHTGRVEPERNKAPLRILHLEDDPLDVELIERELKRHDIPCVSTHVSTREKFEAAFQQGGIDLIISDSKLPNCDMLSALRWAQETNPNIPFVFVSGTSSPQVRTDAIHAGATDFWDKNDLAPLVEFVSRLTKAKPSQKLFSRLPDVGTPVMVQCKGFRCLAYVGADGKWHDYKDSSELPEVTNWWAV